jgi:hypothetical protein
MLRRAIDDHHNGSAFWQPEASRPTQDRIIIIIQYGDAPEVHFLFLAPDFQHYTREWVTMEGKLV